MGAKNWNDLADIADVVTLTPEDEKCLEEVQRVIEAHNLTAKFGVALLHKHFDIGADEILLEITFAAEKRLEIRPVLAEGVDLKQVMTTIWRFDGGARYGCSYCNRDHHT